MQDSIGSDILGKGKSKRLNTKLLDTVKILQRGSLHDATGETNTDWVERIPQTVDGRVPMSFAGFISTGHGTSCASCIFNKEGMCPKVFFTRGSRVYSAPIKNTDCCNFYQNTPTRGQRIPKLLPANGISISELKFRK